MAFDLPPQLRTRIEVLAAAQGSAALRARADALTAAYRQGSTSSAVDVAAYLTTRMPATFAAISSALHHVVDLMPKFLPESMADIGAGPGTASLAAQKFWPALAKFDLIERDPRFAAVAAELVKNAVLSQVLLQNVAVKADLVVAGYVLAELPIGEIADAAHKLWRAATQVLVVVEPGTPHGFSRIRSVRETLLSAGAHLVGPCTQEQGCPMVGEDWCHFKVRLARARSHMHAKGASVPFEDEAFSWVAFARQGVSQPRARIIAPPQETKAALSLSICSAAGLTTVTFASRDKAIYKRVRKLKWGDSLNP